MTTAESRNQSQKFCWRKIFLNRSRKKTCIDFGSHHTLDYWCTKCPLLGTQVHIGTFLTFLVPIESLFIFQGTHLQCFGLIHTKKISLGSLLGPYFIKNKVPIGSQFHKKLGPYFYAHRSLKFLAIVLITTGDNDFWWLLMTDKYWWLLLTTHDCQLMTTYNWQLMTTDS